MFDTMSDRDFVDFLAALWESRGWSTGVREREPGVYMITGDRNDGSRGLMVVVPDPEASVSGQLLQTLARIGEDSGVDVTVAATRGTYTDAAEQVAHARDIHLLDPSSLERTVAKEDAYDLLEEFTRSGGSPLNRLPNVSLPLPGVPGRTLRVAIAGVVAVALVYGAVQFLGFGGMLDSVLAGLGLPSFVLPSLPIPDVGLGLGGGGGFPVTAVSLADGNGTTVDIRWTARQQDVVVAPNGARFESGENRTFVVVQLNVTNPVNRTLILRPQYLSLSANGTRYGVQFLKGGSGQLPIQVPANSSKRGYVVYSIPADADSATILGMPGTDVPPFRFERDRSLDFQVDRG
ncbi:MAG: restriction endonuclease [Halodesulfurarchaeum sp.]